MQFALTDEQRMLQDSVDRFIERDYDFEHRRALIATDEGFSDKHWKTFAELGWLGVPFSEEQGGYGGGLVEAGLILEGFGRGLVVEPYLWTVVLGGGLLSLAGRDDLLAEVIAGDLQLAFAFAEPQSRYDLADVQTRAEKDGGGFKLTGHKAVVFNAPAAGRIIVPARTAGDRRDAEGISLFLVDPAAAGVSLRGYPTVDGLRAAEVELDGVSVGDDALLGAVDKGYPLFETVVDRATAALACEAVPHRLPAALRQGRTQQPPAGTARGQSVRQVDVRPTLAQQQEGTLIRRQRLELHGSGDRRQHVAGEKPVHRAMVTQRCRSSPGIWPPAPAW